MSLLPLIERLSAEVLVTTGTVTSAGLMAERLPRGRARHQFMPIDHPAAVARFLDHWRPDLAIWVESELWPNLILETRRRGVPMALINARMSEESFRRWRRWPGLIRAVLGSFELVLAQDEIQAGRLAALGAAAVETVGDLKAAGAELPVDPDALAALAARLAGRPVWLAASTHAGEEDCVAAAHVENRAAFPGLVTLLAPRHPARADAIEALLAAHGLSVARRSRGEMPDREVYLIDTMGELGLFYRLAPLVLVAGSLGAPGSVGGHNPFEAAGLGCAILIGPDTVNCARATAALEAEGAALRLASGEALAGALAGMLGDPPRIGAMGEAARRVAGANREVIERVVARLTPLLRRIEGHGHAGA
jgi:3-deoxy-D-manno-octulosonic-acid transferase